ncbi:RHS repeat-associated core domain-containing protein, partial [Tenacibaculum maritimum]|uniref:RHS repeat-associated core domain-containing protein n=1 Tax=Tenacibaculum maritimum TaxID=107401 RepID=UPI00132F693F
MKKNIIAIITICFSLILSAQKKGKNTSLGDTFTYKKLDIVESTGESSSDVIIPKKQEVIEVPRSSNSGIGETPGYLSVSLTGAMVYEIPIAAPIGIKGIAPEISLRYNSQSKDGVAGYGWNIGGLSSISRIPSTKYHDNNIDGVDYDSSDRFALDGQRLILKSGVYGADGAIYETESFSNLKIVSHGIYYNGTASGPAYFVVYYPDGSKAFYGNNSNSKTLTTYAISSWEDHKNIRIDYSYTESYNTLNISKIKYGSVGNTNASSPVNEIRFNYSNKARPQQAFVTSSFVQSKLLKKIESFSNNVRYRSYELNHYWVSEYSNLTSVRERSGDDTKTHSNISFKYNSFLDNIHYEGLTTTGLSNVEQRNSRALSLDITGNGRMDYLVYPNTKNKFWLFKDVQNGSYNFPYEVNTGNFKSIFPVTALNHQGKILSGQNIGIVQDGSNNTVDFKVYSNGLASPIYYQYTKTWNQPTYSYSSDPNYSTQKRIPFEYLSGDFNGDGLTEVIAIGKPYTSRYCYYHGDCNDSDPCEELLNRNAKVKPIDCLLEFQRKSGQIEENEKVDRKFLKNKADVLKKTNIEVSKPVDLESSRINNCGYSCYSSTTNYKSVYMISLKRNANSGNVKLSGYLQKHLSGNYKLLTGDFNGDGKTDILHITEGKIAYVYGFNNNDSLQLLWSSNLTSTYNSDPNWPFMLGDYNGDGKTDFMYATAKNSATFVLALSQGINFHIGNKTMPFTFQTSVWNGTELNTYNYIPIDVNGDGKTDIVRQHAKTYNNSSNGTLYVRTYHSEGLQTLNNPLSMLFYNRGGKTVTGNLKHYPIPIFLSSDQENKGLELATLSHNWIKKFSFESDFNGYLINRIYNNGVRYEIDYNNIDSSLYNEDRIQTYTPGYDQLYPNVDINVASNLKVATMFRRISDDSPTVKQSFGYHGGVYNVEGLGFLGFQGIAKSNWYENNSDRIFNVSKFDINLRGALKEEYSQTYSFSFNHMPSNFISKTTYQNSHSISSSKVFKSWVTSKETDNNLQGFNINTTYEYDTYNNPTNIYTNYNGHGSSNISYAYANSTGTNYYIGRATKRIETTTIGGNAFSTEQQFAYLGYQLVEIKSKGNGTNFNSVTFEYDIPFGNVIKQTTTPSGEPSRIVRYEYDNSGRFMKKHTDVEGLVSNFQYNLNTGTLTSTTNAYGQTTSYEYDSWNRQTKATDYLGKVVTTSYVKTSNGYTVTSNGDDGSGMVSIYDRLQRLSEVHEKNVLGQWTKIKYEYDKFDRLSRVSEPYSGSPTQWNETFYDIYGRITEQDLYTGKVFNVSYNGLTTTVSDGTKTVSSTTDAMRNIRSVTDPGGTINYIYHGNGSLKSTNYKGIMVSIDIDGWGRKTKLTDPSAGVYQYEYNGFGEITKEINPKGTTEYSYSSIGKLQQKRIYGDKTDMTISYTYHPIHKFPTSISLASADGNNSNYAYTYDRNIRLTSITENNPFAQFKKEYTYDGFGRIHTENHYARLLSNNKTSQNKITNTYQNGGVIQIKDFTSGDILWKVNRLNARGQITEATFGQVKSSNAYDDYGYLSRIKIDKVSNNTNLMTLNYDFDAQRGLLNSRTNSMFSWSETFGYDSLDRLITFNDNDGNKSHQYDNFGRITENSIVGSYNYQGTSFQLSGVDLNSQGDLFYQNNNLQQVSYNAFKSPHEIKQEDKDRIGFQYNAFLQRSHRFYGGFEEDVLQRNKRKHYSFDGSMEISHDVASGDTSFVTFIGGDAYSAPVIWKSENTSQGVVSDFYYLHRDHMNSILLITDSDGNAKEKRHFDAWGNIVQLTDGNGNSLENFKILDRGYTGHEHLNSVGLIHMNGRLYNANLKRFLSPDNYIQDMTNTQNFNRYGYVLNNPLMYWDPSGEQTEFGQTETGGSGSTLTWLGAVLVSTMTQSWDAVKNWGGWKKIGDAIAEVGRFF